MKSKTDAERNERFYKALAIDTIIEEFFIWYSKGSIIPKFRRQLRKIGYRITRDIDMQYYCQQHPKETRKLILEYYSKTQNLCDKDFFIMCLCSRENSDLFDFFMNEYKKYSSIEREENNICNIIADLLYITRDIKYKEEYLKYYNCIQRDHKKYWIGSYYIWVIKILGDFQLEEAVPQLIEEIKTRSGKYYDAALEALKKYDNQKRFQKVYDSNQKWSKGNFYDMDLKKLALHDKKIKTGLFPEQSTIPEFELFLQGKFGLTTKLSVQDYCQEHPNETKSIVIEFYRKSKLLFDQQFYLGCL
ncbi:MAG: hypothetical protein KH135_05835, partial [Firmicutes bacterium]|nr:hypothetical protein [Bacillota bacterium]